MITASTRPWMASRREAAEVSRLKTGAMTHATSMTVASCRRRIRARAVPTRGECIIRPMFIVGIDVGGTFTDLTAVDEGTGPVVVTKVSLRRRHEADAVLAGLAALGIAACDVRRLVHGTTVGTNAVLERRGARVAVVTTTGLRDLIEIGRTKRNIPALFVPTFVRPKPVVERKHRFEIVERLTADGAVLAPLDPASVERALDAAAAAGAEALAVCFLHAYLNPAHERAVADAAKGRYPGVAVSCSADVVAEYCEFERFSTTVLNAYLQPLMDGYLAGLEERLRATGYAHGVLTVASSGGMMTTETARRLPIKTIFSGPGGGGSEACFVGEVGGVRDFITYDMGGTSTDVCLVRDLAPLTTSDGTLGAFPVKVPQLDMHSVGAGGGSIAWLDVDGSLQVGPRSAGAAPGPVAYRLGGTEPTVTDASVRVRRGAPAGGAARPRRGARPRGLRPRRHGADGDRRQRGAGPHRHGEASGRHHRHRCARRPPRPRRARQAPGPVDDRRGARRGRHHDRGRADDLGDPRDLDPARARSARLHVDRLRGRRAHARPRPGPGARDPARAGTPPSRQLLGARASRLS